MTASAVVEALQDVFDPELGVDIVSLGLIYGIAEGPGSVTVEMTVTTSSCPMSGAMMDAVGEVVRWLRPGVTVEVVPVFEPQWDVDMMTDEARAWLGLPPLLSAGTG